MNKAKKNIVIVGFANEECNSLGLPYIERNIVHYVDSISDAIKYQGYLLIINNKENLGIVDLDKKYRKSFHKFENVWIYNEKYKWTENKWSGVVKVNRNIFRDVSYSLTEEWEEYKSKKEKGKPCEFHACIRFDKAEYYYHTKKEDNLNDKQKEELVKFFNSKSFNITNWETLILRWNTNNNKREVNSDLPMPDYLNLK